VKYEGYVIPEGSTVFLNAWACNMDPEVYENPHTFSDILKTLYGFKQTARILEPKPPYLL
jgi:Cytochrome P450